MNRRGRDDEKRRKRKRKQRKRMVKRRKRKIESDRLFLVVSLPLNMKQQPAFITHTEQINVAETHRSCCRKKQEAVVKTKSILSQTIEVDVDNLC